MNARDRQVAKETVRPPAECPACHPENFQQEGPPPNRFADTQTVTELMYRVVGAASTCWVNGTGPAQFDTTQAIAVADDAIDRLIELGWAKWRQTGVDAAGMPEIELVPKAEP